MPLKMKADGDVEKEESTSGHISDERTCSISGKSSLRKEEDKKLTK